MWPHSWNLGKIKTALFVAKRKTDRILTREYSASPGEVGGRRRLVVGITWWKTCIAIYLRSVGFFKKRPFYLCVSQAKATDAFGVVKGEKRANLRNQGEPNFSKAKNSGQPYRKSEPMEVS